MAHQPKVCKPIILYTAKTLFAHFRLMSEFYSGLNLQIIVFCKVNDMLAGLYFMLIIFANVAQSTFSRFYRATGNHLALSSHLVLLWHFRMTVNIIFSFLVS